MSKHQKELAELPNTLKVQPKLTRGSRLSQSILKAVVEVNLSERMLMLILCVQYLSFQHDRSSSKIYQGPLCSLYDLPPTERDHRERGEQFHVSVLTCFSAHSSTLRVPAGYPIMLLVFFPFLISTTRQFDILTARSA